MVDWLVETHQRFNYEPETLYLTVSLLDRYLALNSGSNSIKRDDLGLAATAAFFIATKYEEVNPTEAPILIAITEPLMNGHTTLREMEQRMLRSLDFRITVPTIHTFLVRYLRVSHADQEVASLACYIAEQCLQEYSMLKYLPSTIASCAVYLARKNQNRNPWSATLFKYTDYTESALRPCLQDMSTILTAKSNLQAVKKKYGSQKYGGVANMTLEGI